MARIRLRGTVEVIAALTLAGVIVWLLHPNLDSALPAIVFGLLAELDDRRDRDQGSAPAQRKARRTANPPSRGRR